MHPGTQGVDGTSAHSALEVTLPYAELPIKIRHAALLDDDALFAFCAANPELRIERSANGEILIIPPTDGDSGRLNFRIAMQLGVWAERDGTGVGFDSSTGFLLPNGAERSPDAAWISRARWDTLTAAQQRSFPPLCPDFVIELRSPSDSLASLQEKLEEYIACGARLGWLLDSDTQTVCVYRPNAAPGVLKNPPTLDGETVLPGFVLDLLRVW